MTVEELEKELVNLGEAEKKQLLKRLISDLDATQDDDVERAWLIEAQRRYQQLKEGVVTGVSAEESITRARERLENVRRASS